MRFLKTNTATRVTVGPFFDKTDGVTPETAITVTSCKLTFTVDDAGVPTLVLDTAPTASGGANDMVHITGDDAGFYDLELAAANVNYLGRAMLAITDAATHCPVFHEFMILPALVYDSLISASDNLQVDTIQVGGTTQTAGDIMADTNDIQSRLPAALVSGRMDSSVGAMAANVLTATAINADAITAAKIADNAIDAGAIAADAITAAKIAADAVTEIQSGLSTLNAAGVRSAVGLASANLDTQLGSIDSSITSGFSTVGSDIGGLEDTLKALVVVGFTPVGATGNDTTHVHLDGLTFGNDEINNQLLIILDNSETEYHARWVEDWVLATELATVSTLPFTPVNTDFFYLLSVRRDVTASVAAADIRSAVGLASANLDTQLTDIDNFLDTEIAAIKAKTDQLTFGVSNTVNTNITHVIGDAVQQNGASDTNWGGTP